MIRLRPRLAPLLSLVLVTAGCGQGTDRPEVAPVTGTIVLNGAPVADANVAFYPQAADGGRPATGKTDASGKFTLTTFESGDGAIVGKHKVTVVAAAAATESNDPSALKTIESNSSKIPDKFATADKSTLSADVVSDPTKNAFDWDLGKL